MTPTLIYFFFGAGAPSPPLYGPVGRGKPAGWMFMFFFGGPAPSNFSPWFKGHSHLIGLTPPIPVKP